MVLHFVAAAVEEEMVYTPELALGCTMVVELVVVVVVAVRRTWQQQGQQK